MGFRPLGMQEGGEPIPSDVLAAYQEFIDMTRSNATTEEVAAYIERNRSDLEYIANTYRDTRFNFLRNTLEQFPAAPLPPLSKTSFPNILEVPDRVPPQEMQPPQLMQPMPPMPPMQPMQPMPPRQPPQEMQPTPPMPPTERKGGENTLPDTLQDTLRKFLEQLPETGRKRLEPPQRPGIAPPGGYWIKDGGYVSHESLQGRNMGFRPLAPQGMARGGAPRGTVAGELRPRGYMTAREAGETMRELSKRHDDERSYGGGIGSLYTRRG